MTKYVAQRIAYDRHSTIARMVGLCLRRKDHAQRYEIHTYDRTSGCNALVIGRGDSWEEALADAELRHPTSPGAGR